MRSQLVRLFESMTWPRRVMFIVGCLAILACLAVSVRMLVWLSGTHCFNFDALDCGDHRRAAFIISAASAIAFAVPGVVLLIPGALSYSRARREDLAQERRRFDR